jgi:hypothetical protein
MESFFIEHGHIIGTSTAIFGILWRKFWMIDAKFDGVNRKIDDLSRHIDQKFDRFDQKLDRLYEQILNLNNNHNVLKSKVYGLQTGVERDRAHYGLPPS